ncbi:hypothetical protein EDB81DRAFT_433714 [Dactylonectria macrodidyma]|uniref:Uncharacterized protein n=1 Tax=Dactylonectria macrodidyma TaxID=307937 RepID=A0A9P9JAT0_9HYPO|nr:hypothetical protein EDB81DRAFT_433714 [Dactylonectria macrodidyma]
MKRCTAVCSGRARVGFGVQPRRWASHDRSRLTEKALLEQAESQLGLDVDGNRVRIDTDTKTVNTAVGQLPISPIMDPDWIRGGRREKKRAPGIISGQFRKKLSNNPFAMALLSPIRHCTNTETSLPRYFLQDFELVEHPMNEDEAWWAPGPLALDSVLPVYVPGPWSSTGQTDRKVIRERKAAISNIELRADKATIEADIAGRPVIAEPTVVTESAVAAEPTSKYELPTVPTVHEKRKQGAITIYILARKAVVETISKESASKASKSKPNTPIRNRFLFLRRGTATNALSTGSGIWRSDMHDFVLRQHRRCVVDALIYRADRSKRPDYRFMVKADTWDEAKTVDKKGCILWQSDKVDPIADSYATLDLDNAKFAEKMPVHNLTWLLGEEELQRLRESSETFRDNKIVVLKLWRSESMRKLHLLLWRLQGYQAEIKRGVEW